MTHTVWFHKPKPKEKPKERPKTELEQQVASEQKKLQSSCDDLAAEIAKIESELSRAIQEKAKAQQDYELAHKNFKETQDRTVMFWLRFENKALPTAEYLAAAKISNAHGEDRLKYSTRLIDLDYVIKDLRVKKEGLEKKLDKSKAELADQNDLIRSIQYQMRAAATLNI